MYKPSLMNALRDEYEDAAKKFMDARNVDAHEAECYLMRMKVIGRVMEHTQRMIDGTIGREPLESDHRCATHVATSARA